MSRLARPLAHPAVGGDAVAGVQFDGVADCKPGGRHRLQAAIRPQPPRPWLSASRARARIASCEPSRLRSSSTWPTIMTIGSTAAVIRSPVAQAATSARAISRSVMPCRLGRRRLSQAAARTGTATNAAATPATKSGTADSSASARQASDIASSPAATIARVQPQRQRPALGQSQQDRIPLECGRIRDGGHGRVPGRNQARATATVDGGHLADLAQDCRDPVTVDLVEQTRRGIAD